MINNHNNNDKRDHMIIHHNETPNPIIYIFNSSPYGQNGRHFEDDILKCIFFNENIWILIEISLKFVPNIPALVQIMTWCRPCDKSLSEPMMVQFTEAYTRHSASMS